MVVCVRPEATLSFPVGEIGKVFFLFSFSFFSKKINNFVKPSFHFVTQTGP